MWRAVLGLLSGVILIAVGMALAFDYRGIATRHIELAMRFVHPISSSRRMSWEDPRLVRCRARFIAFDRFFGVLKAVMGVVGLVAGGFLLSESIWC